MKRGFLILVAIVAAFAIAWIYSACLDAVRGTTSGSTVMPHQGDPAKRGGTATVRAPYEKPLDDPSTKRNESNGQPLGHMGTVTLRVQNVSSGHSYPLDADVTSTDDGYTLERVYFVKGGWVDFEGCDLDNEYNGTCDDENGRSWEIEGEN